MKYGFSTLCCPGWQWRDIVTAASDLGFDGVELRGIGNEIYLPKSKALSGEGLRKITSDFDRLGLSIPCLTSGAFLFDASLADSAQREALDYIDFAKKLHAPYVRVLGDRDPGPGHVDEQAVEENLAALLPEAQKAGVVLLIETNGVYAESKKLKALCDRLAHPALGVLWDMHHPYRFFNETPAETYQNLSGYIRHVHVKDSVMQNGKVTYRMTGQGDVPLSQGMAALKDGGYDGFIILEWVKRWDMDLEEPGIVLPHFLSTIKRIG